MNELASGPGPQGRARRALARLPRRLSTLVLLFVVLAGLACTASLYYFQYRPERLMVSAVADTLIKVATEGTISVLSYTPDSMRDDFATAESRLTGDFLAYYQDFTREVVAPAVQVKGVATTAEVVTAALAQQQSDSAVVLLFRESVDGQRAEPGSQVDGKQCQRRPSQSRWRLVDFEFRSGLTRGRGHERIQRRGVVATATSDDDPQLPTRMEM